MQTIRLSAKGQVVIPKEVREEFDLHEGDLLSVKIEGDSLILRKVKMGNWRRWGGILKGTSALKDHEREHKEEVEGEKGA
ncbi:TPA: AbrB/MazE/SpoVT family DNA-binding domain-containing protein [Candidatus Poribacteria bacterium]|nr:AbrB/MazE/SpoVT family DNA-binding domain-containing protein [Candidatus Poribacteria bacterium]HEX30492.1 AbrB/MazE/SpoVT family DNA-binding domain-containing protein [Candidatus Poribacteria bacterium]